MAKVEVKLDGKSLTFGALTQEAFDRLIKKQFSGDSVMGERELVLTSAIEPDPEGAREIFAKFPAAIKPVAKAIVESGTGDAPILGDDVVSWLGVDFARPDVFAWEEMREKLGDERSSPGPEIRGFLLRLADKPQEAGALFERYPASIDPLYTQVSRLAGSEVEIVVKKD
jgi:hypothetical protein